MSEEATLAELTSSRAGDLPGSARSANLRTRLGLWAGRPIPTFALGLLVTLATWSTFFSFPAGGLDPSWVAGLSLAARDNLAFGSDFVWTYGPLGFLDFTVNWDTALASYGFVWQAGLHLGLACSLVWSLRRSVGAPAATLVAFAALALVPLIEPALPIAAALSFAALGPQRPRFAVGALALGGAVLAAVLTLVKLSVGPIAMVMFLLALIGARARPRLIAASAGLYLATMLLLWLLVGQSLADIPDFITNARQIISGYSEAMVVTAADASTRLALAAVVVVALAVSGAAAFASYRDRRARVLGTLVAAVAGFALFKEGVVRLDEAHLARFLATVVALWLVLPWTRPGRALFAAGALVSAALALYSINRIDHPAVVDELNAPAAVGNAFTQIDSLLSPGERTDSQLQAEAFLRAFYGVDPALLAELEGQTVAVEPAEIAAIAAYELDWSPLPVMQGYTAYTAKLDGLNAAALASPSGPQRILRFVAAGSPALATRSLDGRFAAWDPPEQARAELCNFAPLQTVGSWQVLGRVPDRCGEPVALGSVDSSYGQSVDVPAAGPGEVVFVRIDGAGVSGLESLRAALFRAKARYAVVNGARKFRLVPGTTGDGLMLNGDPKIVGVGRFARAPRAKTLAVEGSSGDLRYDFYSMKVALPPAAASTRRSTG